MTVWTREKQDMRVYFVHRSDLPNPLELFGPIKVFSPVSWSTTQNP